MDKQALEDFLRKWGIKGRVTRVDTNYAAEREGQIDTTRTGTFELSLDGAEYKGKASWLTKDPQPTIIELVNDLRSMALACDNADTFDKWATDLGYDTDSRKMEDRYYARCTETRKLERWLGLGRFRELLWQTKGL